MDIELLKKLCAVHAPSGNEGAMTDFLLQYIEQKKNSWKCKPQIFAGDDFQHCIVLVFGTPRTAVYAHIDNIGFTVRYNHGLVKIGGPHAESGTVLCTTDHGSLQECSLVIDDEGHLSYQAPAELPRGTTLSYKPNWVEDGTTVQCCYMDNRLGVWTALKLCETLEHGAIVFSCWEEHGGGSVPYIAKFLFEKHNIRQALISDITWATEGVALGKGVVISMRDSGIPRKRFLDKVIAHAKESSIPFQLEVEGAGGSDGTELQKQPYPIDWCFIGAAEENVHTPCEKVSKQDIESMLRLYRYLIEKI